MKPRLAKTCAFALFSALILLPACRITDVVLWTPPAPPHVAHEVEQVKSIAYYDAPDAETHAHSLDLHLPQGKKNFPIVIFVHGGTWVHGDNRCCGLYSSVGQFLARHGYGVVMPNYRLSPSVKHPEHVKDVARAVAWTHRHIAEHGGNPEQLYLAGHSAGGHLVSLLATDEKYLHAEGMTTADIKGVISVSGVYRIPLRKLDITVGGKSSMALRIDQVLPMRGDGSDFWRRIGAFPGIPLRLDVFAPSFGDKAQVRRDASPMHHVRSGLPPFLLVYGEDDLPLLGDMAEEFGRDLVNEGNEAQVLRVKKRNHHSIIFGAIQDSDPVGGAMLAFLSRR